MNTDKVKTQMRKGILEMCILSLIQHGDLYTSDISSGLKESGILVVEGTLYPLLTRLKNAELLSYRWEESTSGPPRKYYALTEKGQTVLEELKKSWVELEQSVNKITQ